MSTLLISDRSDVACGRGVITLKPTPADHSIGFYQNQPGARNKLIAGKLKEARDLLILLPLGAKFRGDGPALLHAAHLPGAYRGTSSTEINWPIGQAFFDGLWGAVAPFLFSLWPNDKRLA